ncbi:MAG: tRNA (guanosine(37)-N1)-methyltransferase TrmD [Balneolaceae bacterium]|nr:MAG: tRNA (guanosine(37)-N1)-methyltransferase TrmD [Balneolaceae bacterium]
MRIDILSGVPDLLASPLSHSIIRRAIDKQKVQIVVHDLREYSADRHKKIDDYPYGGGAGMVLSPQPIFDCIDKLTSERTYDEIIFTAPDGELFRQKDANELSVRKHLLFLCGHYKGVDQRVRDELITREFSVGDVVLSGGEIPVLMMTDAIVRLLPGVLGDAESALTDSFQENLLEAPVYTRPATFRGASVPDVLLSGNHEKIEQWRQSRAEERTKKKRPDLYKLYTKKN